MLHLPLALSRWAGTEAACMEVEVCVPEGRADRLSLLPNRSAYDKAPCLYLAPLGSALSFLTRPECCFCSLGKLQSPITAPATQPSFQLTPLWRPAGFQAAFSLPEQRPWGHPSALHPSSHCLLLPRWSERGTLRISSLQWLSSMLGTACLWT